MLSSGGCFQLVAQEWNEADGHLESENGHSCLRYISSSSHNPSLVPDDSQNDLLSLLTAFLPLT